MLCKDGTDWTPDAEHRALLQRAYPDVDLDAEIAQMTAWCFANPGKRKTRTGMLRFCNAWIARSAGRKKTLKEVRAVIKNIAQSPPKPAKIDYSKLPLRPAGQRQPAILTTPERRREIAAELARLRGAIR